MGHSLGLIGVICTLSVLMISGAAQAQTNLIVNGDFSEDLFGWE